MPYDSKGEFINPMFYTDPNPETYYTNVLELRKPISGSEIINLLREIRTKPEEDFFTRTEPRIVSVKEGKRKRKKRVIFTGIWSHYPNRDIIVFGRNESEEKDIDPLEMYIDEEKTYNYIYLANTHWGGEGFQSKYNFFPNPEARKKSIERVTYLLNDVLKKESLIENSSTEEDISRT